MSMDREAYRLANEIRTELYTDGDFLEKCPGEEKMKYDKSEILKEIKKEKKGARLRRGAAAAACAAFLLAAGGMMFGEEVHAALLQMKWSMSSALGLSDDLAKYSEVIHTSVTNDGYVLTLQEVVVSENQVAVNCTFEREDGAPLGGLEIPNGTLYINGKDTRGGQTGAAMMLNDEGTAVGLIEKYSLFGDSLSGEKRFDLSKENDFRLVYEQWDREDGRSGTWEFAFTASGADLIADTRRTVLARTFELPGGGKLTLTELTSNELEQRIYYEFSGKAQQTPMIKAEDSDGNRVEFGMIQQDAGGGYLVNQEIVDDGSIGEAAKSVKLTLYVRKTPERSGAVTEEDYVQVGEPFEVTLM